MILSKYAVLERKFPLISLFHCPDLSGRCMFLP